MPCMCCQHEQWALLLLALVHEDGRALGGSVEVGVHAALRETRVGNPFRRGGTRLDLENCG